MRRYILKSCDQQTLDHKESYRSMILRFDKKWPQRTSIFFNCAYEIACYATLLHTL